jgi:GTPase SAR1 family protein
MRKLYEKDIMEFRLKSLEATDMPSFGSQARRVLVVGCMSAGKSTLVNALVGYPVNECRNEATTSSLLHIYNKPEPGGMTLFNEDHGNYHQQDDPDLAAEVPFTAMGVHFRSLLSSQNICMIDTPGVNNCRDEQHGKITEHAIRRGDYDLLLFVADGRYPGISDETQLLEYVHDYCDRPIIVAVNQLDTYNPRQDSIKTTIEGYASILHDIGYPPDTDILPVSAQTALWVKQPDEYESQLTLMMEQQSVDRFTNDFYDLPHYATGEYSPDTLSRTGVVLLEQTIIKRLKKSK